MDKYEFNIKVEQLRKLANKGDYDTALKIVETIDWKKVRNANLLSMVAQVYEKNHEYQNAKDILLLAFERAPIGKRLLFKLTDLAVKEGNTEEAEAYYREFCDLAVDDPRQHLLRYMILKQKGAPAEQLIHSLEGYTAEELDEKWLYELALLYHEAGEEAACVVTCDKIMLMFGLGKYVDQAMELKLLYAPLTKYQMDLVENREKYEAKLRAVEQSFNDVTDREEDYVAATPRMQMEEEEPAVPDIQEPIREIAEEERVEPTAAMDLAEPSSHLDYEPEAIEAAVKQAEVEEHLAKEMSRISVEEYVQDEDESGQTRVLGDLKRAQILSQETTVLPDINKIVEPARNRTPVAARVSEPAGTAPPIPAVSLAEEIVLPKAVNHLMIEAKTPEKGLEMATEALRQIQLETGIKNPVAKITGSKLNKRGILSCADKLRGKDLMIEEAGDLSPEILKELENMMAQDTSGMRVILIDNPKQMEMLHVKNISLASKFELIGSGDVPAAIVAGGNREIPTAGAVAGGNREIPTAGAVAGGNRELPVASVMAAVGGNEIPAAAGTAAGGRGIAAVGSRGIPTAAAVTAVRNGMEESVQPEVDDRPVRHITPVRDAGMRVEARADYEYEEDEQGYGDEEEMDIDEFAQYACKYASEIDCSITGKSMLALYERIEIMEEDGIPLTRGNAEALIEEAADRAEKPSLGKLIAGVFSSKYDKDGLLILKEEHFI